MPYRSAQQRVPAWRRALERRRKRVAPEAVALPPAPAQADPGPEPDIITPEAAAMLRDALKALEKAERAVVATRARLAALLGTLK